MGRREGEKKAISLIIAGYREARLLHSLTLGDPCTLSVLLLQVLAHVANIWLWEEIGLIWWEEEGQRGYCLVD